MPSANLITNPTLKVNTDGWMDAFGTITATPDGGRFYHPNLGGSFGPMGTSDAISCQPGEPFRLSGVRYRRNTGAAGLRIRLRGSSGVFFASYVAPVGVLGQWYTVPDLEVVIPAGSDTIEVHVDVAGGTSGSPFDYTLTDFTLQNLWVPPPPPQPLAYKGIPSVDVLGPELMPTIAVEPRVFHEDPSSTSGSYTTASVIEGFTPGATHRFSAALEQVSGATDSQVIVWCETPGGNVTLYDTGIQTYAGQPRFGADVVVPADATSVTAQTTFFYDSSAVLNWLAYGYTFREVLALSQPSVRLEIEADPPSGALVNEIKNPSGEQGGFGWATPINGSTLIGQEGELRYDWSLANAGGQFFYSDMFAVAAGQYVAGFWHVNYTPYGRHRARIEWFTSTQAANGVGSWASFTTDYTDCNLPPVQAPANTVYARIRFETSKSGGVYPNDDTGGAGGFSVDHVTVAQAATTVNLGSVRTNLCTNPSVETTLTGWTGSLATLSADTVNAFIGSRSMKVTPTGTAMSAYQQDTPVRPGRPYTLSVYHRLFSGITSPGRMFVQWFNSAGTMIGSAVGESAAPTADWSRLTLTATAPAGATKATIGINYPAAPPVVDVDAVLFEESPQTGPYFDGNLPADGTKSYAWTGTGNASTSVEVDSNLTYIEPITYINILGDTHQISVTREELNVGTLNATVVNPALDPSVEDTLRPGREFRLMAYNPANGFEPLIQGKLTNAKVAYFPLNKPEHSAKITLSGTDNVTPLANAKRPSAVATIDELPYVLEGAGVPWNVNGSGQQVASADVILSNDNASALDQIALTRDTELGYAWLDRFGTVQVWSTLPSTVDHVLGEAVYNPDIVVDFDTDRTINSVQVRRQWTHPSEGPQETVYGPYEDAASIAEWGRQAGDFSVAGTTPGSIPAYAAGIIAANKTPQVLVRSLQVPVNAPERLPYAMADLYDLAAITNGSLERESRITTVKHSITATTTGGEWLMDLEFAADGGVATPTVQPPLSASTVDYAWHTVGDPGEPAFTNGWVNTSGAVTRFRLDRAGNVHVQGTMDRGTDNAAAFTLPDGYRPTALTVGVGVDNTVTIVQMVVQTTGAVQPNYSGTPARVNFYVVFSTA